ncbi:MAG: alpha/beta hydrolase family protein [Vulcanimicrobiota bacterium]
MADSSPGKHLDFFDPVRARPVPSTYYPGGDCLALFSVGFGGSRDGYAYLARHWQSLGFSVLVVEHAGSGVEALRQLNRQGRQRRDELLWQRVVDPVEVAHRPRDASFALTSLIASQGRPGRVLAAGHSFGSYTVLALAGLPIWGRSRYADPRIEAGLAISPTPPGVHFYPESYAELTMPMLFLTGTLDDVREGVGYQARLESFRLAGGADQHLVVLEGAQHLAFANIGLGLGPILSQVKAVTGAYLESWRDGHAFRAPREVHWEQRGSGQR